MAKPATTFRVGIILYSFLTLDSFAQIGWFFWFVIVALAVCGMSKLIALKWVREIQSEESYLGCWSGLIWTNTRHIIIKAGLLNS